MDETRWHVAQTQPHREAAAETHLRQQAFRVFSPKRAKTIRHARQTRTILAPLFPGYLFVQFDPGEARWRSINGTFGVRRLLTAGEAPLPVPRGVVEALIEASDARGQVREDLRRGDKVRLIAGPFAEAIATIDQLNDAGRVAVLLQIMNAEIRVRLPQDWLQKAPAQM